MCILLTTSNKCSGSTSCGVSQYTLDKNLNSTTWLSIATNIWKANRGTVELEKLSSTGTVYHLRQVQAILADLHRLILRLVGTNRTIDLSKSASRFRLQASQRLKTKSCLAKSSAIPIVLIWRVLDQLMRISLFPNLSENPYSSTNDIESYYDAIVLVVIPLVSQFADPTVLQGSTCKKVISIFEIDQA